MNDTNQIRRKVQQARELAQQGKLPQAKALLRGIHHPKVAALLAQLDAEMGVQPHSGRVGRFTLPILVLVIPVLVVVVGGFMLFRVSRQRPGDAQILPTVMPTSDCTHEIIQSWWQKLDAGLIGFAADASSASRTMPGERLTQQLDHLREFRDNVPSLPGCAEIDMQIAVNELLAAMDQTITAAERWGNGQVDGTRATQEFDLAETALDRAKTQLREILRK